MNLDDVRNLLTNYDGAIVAFDSRGATLAIGLVNAFDLQAIADATNCLMRWYNDSYVCISYEPVNRVRERANADQIVPRELPQPSRSLPLKPSEMPLRPLMTGLYQF